MNKVSRTGLAAIEILICLPTVTVRARLQTVVRGRLFDNWILTRTFSQAEKSSGKFQSVPPLLGPPQQYDINHLNSTPAKTPVTSPLDLNFLIASQKLNFTYNVIGLYLDDLTTELLQTEVQ